MLQPWDPKKLPGLFFAVILLTIGTVWAFTRGGDDFRVFYHAWALVLSGRGAEIYQNSPDRFLYAPGFAWGLAPLALLPEQAALAFWCAAKISIIGWIVFVIAKALRAELGIASWGVILLARPILIDLQYGQVNLIILGACFWAVFRYFDFNRCSRASARLDFLSWALLGAVAVTKLFPLPLLLIPLLNPASTRTRKASLLGAISGVGAVILLPLLTLGPRGFLQLYPQWTQALLSRGLPLESHNQSFAAFLYHFLSGEPTEIIAQHRRQMLFGYALLSLEQIRLLTAAWLAATSSIILALVIPFRAKASLRQWALLIALLVVPSHLVWKPYFTMGLPLAILAVEGLARRPSLGRILVIGLVLVLMNCTGFDFVGLDLGARLEALSLMLAAYLILCGFVITSETSPLVSPLPG